MEQRLRRVIFTCGGTAGHVNPAIALAQLMHEKYPADESIADDCEWYTDNFEDIFEMFMKDDFIFSLGFQLYLAKK